LSELYFDLELEADSHSASQEIPHLLWNPKDHYRVQNSQPFRFLSYVRWIQSTNSHFISQRCIL